MFFTEKMASEPRNNTRSIGYKVCLGRWCNSVRQSRLSSFLRRVLLRRRCETPLPTSFPAEDGDMKMNQMYKFYT